jgi:hypothetical protein
MTSTAKGSGTAHDATVQAGPAEPDEVLRQRTADYAEQVAAEVAAMEAKLAGWKDALAAKKAELKDARAAVREGGED